MEKVPMTPQGHQGLMDELRNLKEVERQKIIADLAEARAHGDLKENAEYHAARERQSFNEGRIQELESVLTRIEVIDYTKFSGDNIRFGATVELYDEQTEQNATYMIVGHYEADINKNRLSLQAPLSRALIGKNPGDVVKVTTPGGQKSYEILTVSY
ncbi:MAG: transcription elongation factor GreA [Alphaproteobacteria bacterium]|nr:transcription elongation factor GreA [Alphaproteobacteria bacterium]